MVEKKGTAIMVVYTDVAVEHDADFNAWYNQEHLPERLSNPGFLDGARYEALRGGPRYLAVYELESAEALQSDEYLRQRANPTDWSKRVSPLMAAGGMVRNEYTQIYPAESDPHTLGRGMAPALQIGRMDVPPEIEDKYNYYYDNVRTAGNLKIPGCMQVRRYQSVEGWPKYLTMYEFEHEKVPETVAWENQRGQDAMHEYIGGTYGHAFGFIRRVPPCVSTPRVLTSDLLARPRQLNERFTARGGGDASKFDH